jgi:hypothetical protein
MVDTDLLNGPIGKSTTYLVSDYFEEGTKEFELVSGIVNKNIGKMINAINEGADVSFTGKSEMTPLLMSYGARYYDGFELLLQNGADPNFETKKDFLLLIG